VEVWRKPSGQAWARDFIGIYRHRRVEIRDRSTFTGYCPGIMSMLGWRHVMWKAGTANRSRFVAAIRNDHEYIGELQRLRRGDDCQRQDTRGAIGG